MPQPASAGRQLVDPRGEQLMAFRIAERAHSASQTPAVFEVVVHRGPLLLVRVPPVPFPASGLSSGAFLLEAFPVPHRQHPPAGIAELADHVRGAALVSDVQVHGPVTLLLAVLRHKGVLLPGQEVQENVTTSLCRHLFLNTLSVQFGRCQR